MYWSTIKRFSTTEYNGMEVQGQNPCLGPATYLQTDRGLTQISALVGKERFAASDSEGITIVNSVWGTGIKPLHRFHTSAGYFIDATMNHAVMARKGCDITHLEQLILEKLPSKWVRGQELSEKIRLGREYSGQHSTIYKAVHSLELKGLVNTDTRYTRRSPKPIREFFILRNDAAIKSNLRFEWRKFDELSQGDKLLMSVKECAFPQQYLPMPKFTQAAGNRGFKRNQFVFPDEVNEAIGGLLGWIVTDGSAIPDRKSNGALYYNIQVISLNDEQDMDIKLLFETAFGRPPSGGYWRNLSRPNHENHKIPVKDWIVNGNNL